MKILAFTGKRQSGKDDAAEFLIRNLKELFPDWTAKRYAFADKLKEFCRDYLGIEAELLWGSDEQKNTLSDITWESMPHYASLVASYKERCERMGIVKSPPSGFMSVREVLQQVATEWFRGLRPNIWVDLLRKQLMRECEPCKLALITDMRFPNEVEMIHGLAGKVVRLTRSVPPVSLHYSETALDDAVFDWNKFDLVINNQYLNAAEKNKALVAWLKHINWIKS